MKPESTNKLFQDTNPDTSRIIASANVTFATTDWSAQAVGYVGAVSERFYDLNPTFAPLSVKVFQKLGVLTGIDWYPVPYTSIDTNGTVLVNYWVDILNTTVNGRDITEVIINGYSKYNTSGYPAGAYQDNRFIIKIESIQIEDTS